MPSVSQLFIRVPKYVSSEHIFDAINETELCKVCHVTIKRCRSNSNNIAIVKILHWYKGSKDIRETLKAGGAMYIPSIHGNDLVAYKFVSKNKPEPDPNPEPEKREVDEFGRDIDRNVLMKDDTDVSTTSSSERTYNSEETNISRAQIQRENAAAAECFIRNFNVPVYNRI